MRLIDADAAAASLKGSFERNRYKVADKEAFVKLYDGCSELFTAILTDERCTPTINARVVNHGYWIPNGESNYVACSECSFHQSDTVAAMTFYCPHCGAQMGEPPEMG